MSNVEFQEENQGYVSMPTGSSSKMANWLIKRGWAQDETGANKGLLVAACIFFILTLIVIIM